jgi:hypothetical protein
MTKTIAIKTYYRGMQGEWNLSRVRRVRREKARQIFDSIELAFGWRKDMPRGDGMIESVRG